jgi:hypothetical protein
MLFIDMTICKTYFWQFHNYSYLVHKDRNFSRFVFIHINFWHIHYFPSQRSNMLAILLFKCPQWIDSDNGGHWECPVANPVDFTSVLIAISTSSYLFLSSYDCNSWSNVIKFPFYCLPCGNEEWSELAYKSCIQLPSAAAQGRRAVMWGTFDRPQNLQSPTSIEKQILYQIH